jgi:hypothetical protein
LIESLKTNKNVGILDLNNEICRILKHQFNPLGRKSFKLWDLIHDVSPIPTLKITQFASGDNEYSWSDLTTSLLSTTPHSKNRATLRSVLTFCGPPPVDPPQQVMTRISTRMGNIYPSTVKYYQDSKRSISSCTNSTDSLEIIEPFFNRAKEMYKERAYVHWYERYEQDCKLLFDEAFEGVQSIIDNYKSL